MNLEQLAKLSYKNLIQHIVKTKNLHQHAETSHLIWKILPAHIVNFLTHIQGKDIQIGDFIIARMEGIEKGWSISTERVENGDWIPIIIGSTEIGEGIAISYNQNEKYCADTINVISYSERFIQGVPVAENFDTFLRINLILDTIKEEHLFQEDGCLNSVGEQRLKAALEIFYPNYTHSEYWLSWIKW